MDWTDDHRGRQTYTDLEVEQMVWVKRKTDLLEKVGEPCRSAAMYKKLVSHEGKAFFFGSTMATQVSFPLPGEYVVCYSLLKEGKQMISSPSQIHVRVLPSLPADFEVKIVEPSNQVVALGQCLQFQGASVQIMRSGGNMPHTCSTNTPACF